MQTAFDLTKAIKNGDLERLHQILNAGVIDVNTYDRSGHTPLMHAVRNSKASVEFVRTLLSHGASIDVRSSHPFEPDMSLIALAVSGGDPEKVKLLLEIGADIHYSRSGGYDALLDAVHGREILRDTRLIDLLKLLITVGVNLNSITSYQESGLRVTSRIGRFDAVKLLLDAGSDESQLGWTPLIWAVALGSQSDVVQIVRAGAPLEEKDWWERTAWLVAIQTGDTSKAQLLRERGSDTNAYGRCGKPSLFFAIENHHERMLRWLLEIGISINQLDDFGITPLMTAVDHGNLDAVTILLDSGADVNVIKNGQTALYLARSREIAMRLLDAGADPCHLTFEGRRTLLGYDPEPDDTMIEIAPSEFKNSRKRRFGRRNPHKFRDPYYQGMIRSGISGYQAGQLFHDKNEETNSPIWCAQRYGQSITFLPDGRVVQIGGEHEDGYDPDFCIYNDVFVHKKIGTIDIFGYPKSVFPPTDFHTATLLGDHIYVIGSLGYQGERKYGTTPVYRLDASTFRAEQVITLGEAPGWIHKHRAVPLSGQHIQVSGGSILTWRENHEVQTDNDKHFVLDVISRIWRIEPIVNRT